MDQKYATPQASPHDHSPTEPQHPFPKRTIDSFENESSLELPNYIHHFSFQAGWEVFSELSAKPGGTCNEPTINPLHHTSLHIISTTQINITKPSSS